MKSLFMAFAVLISFSSALAKDQIVPIEVTESGFSPASINVKPGELVVLEITRKTENTCATDIQIKSKKIKKKLPLNKLVRIPLGKLEKGEIRFSCSMNMISGNITVQ